MRTRGFAAFSYADLAERVGIRKASIHHHFPTKEALGIELINRYLAHFRSDIDVIEKEGCSAVEKLSAYGRLFHDAVTERRLPFCGALAAEFGSIPLSMQDLTRRFFRVHLDWLTRVIAQGVAARCFRQDIDPANSALVLLSGLEGVSLIVWVTGDVCAMETVFEDLTKALSA